MGATKTIDAKKVDAKSKVETAKAGTSKAGTSKADSSKASSKTAVAAKATATGSAKESPAISTAKKGTANNGATATLVKPDVKSDVKPEVKATSVKATKSKSTSSPIDMDKTMAKTKTPAKAAKTAKKSDKKKTDIAPVDKMYEDNEHLKTAVDQIEQQFGSGSIMTLGNEFKNDIRGISTGSLSLDMALGGSGLPCGRIVEVYGPESSGKTTLALHAVAEAQKSGGICAIVDAEHAFDPTWAKKLGVSLDTLLVSQPSSGEEAMQIVEMLVKSNSVDVIIIDSVAALVPKKELEGEIGDSHVGLQARLMSQSMRKLTGAISRSKTCTIFINQIREKIGVMFGSPETTPGGRALKFYSSVRIDVRRIGALKDGDIQVGQRVKAKIVKNKVAPPFRVAEFDMMHSDGISFEGDVLDLGKVHKIVQQSGSWFKYGTTHLGQGKEKARNFLRENKDICEEIRAKVMEAGGYVEDMATALVDAEAGTEVPKKG
jgi:recombination protein RecA